MYILNICCISMFFISSHIKVKCIRKCSLSQPARVLRYFCSTCTILGNEGVVARTWKYDSLSRLPPGQFVTRFADFFRVLSRGKRGGKREMEIEKLEKGGVELEHGSLCFIGSLDITFVAATISFYASTLFKTLYPFVQSP